MVVLQCPACGAGLMPGATTCANCSRLWSEREAVEQKDRDKRFRDAYTRMPQEIPNPYERLVRVVAGGIHFENGEPYQASAWIHLAIPEFTSAPRDQKIGTNGAVSVRWGKTTLPELQFDKGEVARWYVTARKINSATETLTVTKERWWGGSRTTHLTGWRFPPARGALDRWILTDGAIPYGLDLYTLAQMGKNLPRP